MNAGTSIFLIVLVLIGSFAGLGYLINQNVAAIQDREAANARSHELEVENASLRQQLTHCQAETTSEREAKEAAYSEARRLQAQVAELTVQLTQCNQLQGQGTASQVEPVEILAQTPSTPNQAVEPAASAAQSGSGSNTITWLMLATMFITMVTGSGSGAAHHPPQPAGAHPPPPASHRAAANHAHDPRADPGVRRLEAPQRITSPQGEPCCRSSSLPRR